VKIQVLSLAIVIVASTSVPIKAAITAGLTPADFVTPTIEPFVGSTLFVPSHDFGNGMTYANLADSSDLINLSGTYGLGNEGNVTSGRGGPAFEFAFPAGVTQFGFFGAESNTSGVGGRNGEMNLEFYDLAVQLIGTATVTTAGTFAWNQFHGFSSDAPIGSVVFRDAGHMVLDDVHFGPLPEPLGIAWLSIAIAALVPRRRRRRGIATRS
jgi:hypothetical protein